MDSLSYENNNEDILGEEIDGVKDGPPPSSVRGKRTKSQRSSSSIPVKQRKRPAHRAVVWKHFDQKPNNLALSNCRYCKTEIGCDSVKSGTSEMTNHIKRCKLFKMYEESDKQKIIAGESSGVMTAIKYNKWLFRRSVNEMLVLCELPFAFVESLGFRRFCANNLPMYQLHCRTTATKDCYGLYLQEKAALKELFDEWDIKKVFTVTVDNAKGNDKALRLFIDNLILRDPDALVKYGDYLHMRCCAHILNLIVNNGLAKAKHSIMAIRNAIKYVRSSGDRLKSFKSRVESGNATRGSLCLDVVTRWNSTYLMLTAAIKCRGAFEKMLAEDKLYNEYFMEKDEDNEDEDDESDEIDENARKRVGPPTFVSWEEVQRLYSLEANHLRSGIKDVMRKLYEEYVARLSTSSQADSGGATRSDHGEAADVSALFDLTDDDGYERMDSLYFEIVAETANEVASSELDMYLLEKPVPST
ncbi:Ribonuclease H-like superfamily [Arabidopsis suecica]|uniref:Ribonuclease H-like superfamily n=1 Tax=Arabidopsis suecica TaxID=45249 RepID=A0A8T1XH56_ARASU|nr:Ribonuclease H-like superfamily [Arabidopsis suecica]